MSRVTTESNGRPVPARLAALATLLDYPDPDFDAKLARALENFTDGAEDLPGSAAGTGRAGGRPVAGSEAKALGRFVQSMRELPPGGREELFAATFEVNPACVANLGIHLFGEENLKRGEFMAALNARYRQAEFSAGSELPDHLAVLLRFAAGTDEAERHDLAAFCLLGPLNKMIAGLAEENPYRALLEAAREVLRGAYPGMTPAPSPVDRMRSHAGGCAPTAAGCGCGGETWAARPPASRDGREPAFKS